MKLDYDLTILEMQARALGVSGIVEQGWRGPVLDAVVIDRHFDPHREGRRTLADLCALYGVEIGRAHDASADAIASIGVLFALAVRTARSGTTTCMISTTPRSLGMTSGRTAMTHGGCRRG